MKLLVAPVVKYRQPLFPNNQVLCRYLVCYLFMNKNLVIICNFACLEEAFVRVVGGAITYVLVVSVMDVDFESRLLGSPVRHSRRYTNGSSNRSLGSSPGGHRRQVYCDRGLPLRCRSTTSSPDNVENCTPNSRVPRRRSRLSTRSVRVDDQAQQQQQLYGAMVTNELCYGEGVPAADAATSSRSPIRRFNYSLTRLSTSCTRPFSLSPLTPRSRRLLLRNSSALCTTTLKDDGGPLRSLDAPGLTPDFYLNLLDWSVKDQVAVALRDEVFLLCVHLETIQRLGIKEWTALEGGCISRLVTSVAYSGDGNQLAVGHANGHVRLWDVERRAPIFGWRLHRKRVSALAWQPAADWLASAGADYEVHLIDPRTSSTATRPTASLLAHRGEVCGLAWSTDGSQLASGGNDNQVCIWAPRYANAAGHHRQRQSPSSFKALLSSRGGHVSAVKALAWSPRQRGLLASGGGTLDKTVQFHNTLTGADGVPIHTGAQVCGLAWSPGGGVLASALGYPDNTVAVWEPAAAGGEDAMGEGDSVGPVRVLRGHTGRALFMAAAPDGMSVVTGGEDEALCFWRVFPDGRDKAILKRSGNVMSKPNNSVLDLFSKLN